MAHIVNDLTSTTTSSNFFSYWTDASRYRGPAPKQKAPLCHCGFDKNGHVRYGIWCRDDPPSLRMDLD